MTPDPVVVWLECALTHSQQASVRDLQSKGHDKKTIVRDMCQLFEVLAEESCSVCSKCNKRVTVLSKCSHEFDSKAKSVMTKVCNAYIKAEGRVTIAADEVLQQMEEPEAVAPLKVPSKIKSSGNMSSSGNISRSSGNMSSSGNISRSSGNMSSSGTLSNFLGSMPSSGNMSWSSGNMPPVVGLSDFQSFTSAGYEPIGREPSYGMVSKSGFGDYDDDDNISHNSDTSSSYSTDSNTSTASLERYRVADNPEEAEFNRKRHLTGIVVGKQAVVREGESLKSRQFYFMEQGRVFNFYKTESNRLNIVLGGYVSRIEDGEKMILTVGDLKRIPQPLSGIKSGSEISITKTAEMGTVVAIVSETHAVVKIDDETKMIPLDDLSLESNEKLPNFRHQQVVKVSPNSPKWSNSYGIVVTKREPYKNEGSASVCLYCENSNRAIVVTIHKMYLSKSNGEEAGFIKVKRKSLEELKKYGQLNNLPYAIRLQAKSCILRIDQKFEAHTYTNKIYTSFGADFSTSVVPVSVFENISQSALRDAALLQLPWKHRSGDDIMDVITFPRGAPPSVVKEDLQQGNTFPKLIAKLKCYPLSKLPKAYRNKTGVELMDFGLRNSNSTVVFRKLTPLVGLLTRNHIDMRIVYEPKTAVSKFSETNLCALDMLGMVQLIEKFEIPVNYKSDGFITAGPMATAMLHWKPPLAVHRTVTVTKKKKGKKHQTTEERIKESFLENKAELLCFLRESYPAKCSSIVAFDEETVPYIELLAKSEKFFSPTRLYSSGDVAARHLMNLAFGQKFSILADTELAPHPLVNNAHPFTGYSPSALPKKSPATTYYGQPCVVCSLPQIAHRSCPVHYSTASHLCMVCLHCSDNHKKKTKNARKDWCLRSPTAHKFINRSGAGSRIGSTSCDECASCNTSHLDSNRDWRLDLLTWSPNRKQSLFRTNDVSNATIDESDGLKQHISTTLALCVYDVSLDYQPKYNITLECTPRAYQHHAIDWMIDREINPKQALIRYQPVAFADPKQGTYFYNDVYGDFSATPKSIHGGIIASEMGMGKTIMVLAVCSYRGAREANQDEEVDEVSLMSSDSDVDFDTSSSSSLSSSSSSSSSSDSDSDDIVQRKPSKLKPKKKKTSKPSKKLKKQPKPTRPIKRLKLGTEEAAVPEKMLRGGTLIITKASLRGQWSEELRSKLPNANRMKILDYHSGIPSATRNKMILHEADYVVSNYDIISIQRAGDPDSFSPMMNIWWNRVIFDEIHFVANDTTQQAKLTGNIRATHRWLLSGTPVQANLSKVSGLSKALYGVKPADNMKTITKTQLCRWFESCTIRHTVDQCYTDGSKYLVGLDPHTDVVVPVVMTTSERQVYMHAKDQLRSELQLTSNHSRWWSHWLLAATRLRQFTSYSCGVGNPFHTGMSMDNVYAAALGSHESLHTSSWEARDKIANNEGNLPVLSKNEVLKTLSSLIPANRISDAKDIIATASDYECPICFEMCEGLALTKCGHFFCIGCIVPTAASKGECPLCRRQMLEKSLTLISGTEQAIEEPIIEHTSADGSCTGLDGEQPGIDSSPETHLQWIRKNKISSKLSAMKNRIVELRKQDPTCKFVIFTQFESSIRAIETAISEIGYRSEKIVGAMSQKSRTKSLQDFSSNPTSIAFLLTVRSGSCGLNLTSANHVFLMEPCLNPALELQAIGRCHRITQTKQVVAHRFIVEDSIETALHAVKSGAAGQSILSPKLVASYFGVEIPRSN